MLRYGHEEARTLKRYKGALLSEFLKEKLLVSTHAPPTLICISRLPLPPPTCTPDRLRLEQQPRRYPSRVCAWRTNPKAWTGTRSPGARAEEVSVAAGARPMFQPPHAPSGGPAQDTSVAAGVGRFPGGAVALFPLRRSGPPQATEEGGALPRFPARPRRSARRTLPPGGLRCSSTPRAAAGAARPSELPFPRL